MNKARFYQNEADLPFSLYLKQDNILLNNAHFHSSIEFVLVTKGSCIANINGVEKKLTVGDIAFANSYETHFYETTSPEISAIIIVGSNEFTKPIKEFYPDKKLPSFLTDKEKNKEIFSLANDWISHKDKTPLYNIGTLNLFVSKLIEKYELMPIHIDFEEDLLKNMLKYIHDHYLENISLSLIANQFGFTIEHCSKTLKKATKCNFREYINTLRLRKAKSLLEDKGNKMTTSEILYSCGFSSPATYYRVKKTLNF